MRTSLWGGETFDHSLSFSFIVIFNWWLFKFFSSSQKKILRFPTDCRRDIAFVLDNSNFLTPDQFKSHLVFVSSMIETLHDSGSRFAVVSFNEIPQIHSSFTQDEVDKSQIQSVVRFIFTLSIVF